MNGITYIENFLKESSPLYKTLVSEVNWDERMSARKTASFGKAYDYSQISYPFQAFTKELKEIVTQIQETIGFEPNNCLINFYLDGRSKMGFHSDQTDILEEGTGVVIISLGEERILRFRKIADKEQVNDVSLAPGSLVYMTNEVQHEWQHAIPKSRSEKGRISLTFRKIK